MTLFTICFMAVTEIIGGGVTDPPHRTLTYRAEWMPKLQEAAAHHRTGTAIPAEVKVSRGDRLDSKGQLTQNIGPALGWYVRKQADGLIITMPVNDVGLLEDLQQTPETFVKQHASTPQRTGLNGDLVNAHLKVHIKFNVNGLGSAIGMAIGGMITVLGMVHLIWPDPPPTKEARRGKETPRTAS